MDTGKRKVEDTFYKGYEGEKEIVITADETEYHFWDGYFEDIFGTPVFSENGWNGFTRDYNEFVNAFEDGEIECAIIPKEYLKDLLLYADRTFEYSETNEVLETLIRIFEEAEKKHIEVLVRVN